VVDFSNRVAGRASTDAAGATIHHNVSCDICGISPVVDIRHRWGPRLF
jgi:hypothetical protein